MLLKLFCALCESNTDFEILPWQWSTGRFDALSIVCRGCQILRVFELSATQLVEIRLIDDN